jgi:hypothetical protein
MKMESRKQAIDKIYKRRNRYEIPEYQREEVWGVVEKQLLIDTILKGWKLPKFYFLKTSESGYEVVDGQQRLAAIFEFLDGDLSLSSGTSEAYDGAETYDDLDVDVSDVFDDFEINFDEIEDASEEEIQEFFKRLQGGFRLNSAERLNAVPSKLTSYCRSLAKHEFFKNCVPFKDKRYAYFDVAAKAAAIEIEGFDAGMRINDLETLFRSQASFSPNSKVGKRIKAGLDFLGKALPKNSTALRLRSMTQSIINLACKLQEVGFTDSSGAKFAEFVVHFSHGLAEQVEAGHLATDADYLTFQRTVNANVKGAARTRHQVLLRKLFQFEPSFAEGFDTSAVASAGTDKAVAALQKDIIGVTKSVNEIYSSTNGVDLFKATNKTATAQYIMGTLTKDYDAYKALIENLYFLFWEGPGSKLATKPPSFVLINELRTELQHDVDHGGKKGAKKKKALGSAFKSVAGVSSPEAAHPERFPIVQLKILSDIRADLLNLRKSLSTME